MSASERLAQEDRILREIRLSLSTFRTMRQDKPHRKGVVYASAPITSGFRLYEEARAHGFIDAGEFRRAMNPLFRERVFLPNLAEGIRFGGELRELGWRQVIVPGQFFAEGWTQEHYMSLWRQVIVRHTRTVAFADDWAWSLGCSEEFIIALQHEKQALTQNGKLLPWKAGLDAMRPAMDAIDGYGFDVKKHYELWRQATLTLEALQEERKIS
ncbi:MAG: hypothetical protein IT405_00760 [Candidatus Yanofskybacteria bacterium]|nr:hypothetical protein [Candidatus Yanofskybacteria bacterium]